MNPFRYRGEYFDRYTSEYYLRNRDYCPENGRFTTEDPARDRSNWYLYCGNDPVDNVDPEGLAFWSNLWNGVKKAVTAVVNAVKAVNNLAKKATETLTGIASGAKSLGNKFVSTINSIGNNVVDSIKSIGQSAAAGIKNTVEAVVTGAQNRAVEAGKAIENTATAAYNYVMNEDEQVVLDAKFLAFYKGVPVIRTSNDRSGSFGVIFMGALRDADENVKILRHEWGHTQQLAQLGPIKYLLGIVAPSLSSDAGSQDYYRSPWEVTADWYGNSFDNGARRTDLNKATNQDLAIGIGYLTLLKGSSVWYVPWGPNSSIR